MKLIFKSARSKEIQENSFGFIQHVLLYTEYEVLSTDFNFTLTFRVHKGEKTIEKLKQILNQDVEVELPN